MLRWCVVCLLKISCCLISVKCCLFVSWRFVVFCRSRCGCCGLIWKSIWRCRGGKVLVFIFFYFFSNLVSFFVYLFFNCCYLVGKGWVCVMLLGMMIRCILVVMVVVVLLKEFLMVRYFLGCRFSCVVVSRYSLGLGLMWCMLLWVVIVLNRFSRLCWCI